MSTEKLHDADAYTVAAGTVITCQAKVRLTRRREPRHLLTDRRSDALIFEAVAPPKVTIDYDDQPSSTLPAGATFTATVRRHRPPPCKGLDRILQKLLTAGFYERVILHQIADLQREHHDAGCRGADRWALNWIILKYLMPIFVGLANSPIRVLSWLLTRYL